jgi:hypothetical protein
MFNLKKLVIAAVVTACLLGGLIGNANASYPGNSFAIYKEAQAYLGQVSPASGQCKGFVAMVYKNALGIDVPETKNDDWSRWYDSDQLSEVGHVTIDSPSLSINFSRVKNLLSNATLGDAIQMDIHKDSSDPSCHSMIYVGVDNGGIKVIDANWSADQDNVVREHTFSLSELVDYIGAGGGLTIYGSK